MTLNEIIYDIREKLKLFTDDIDIVDEYLAHLVHVKRSLLLKQRYSKLSKTIPEETKQIVCLTFEEVPSIDGQTCMGTIVKSVEKVPTLLQLDNKSALLGVRSHDLRNIPFNIVSIERFPFLGFNKWTANQIYIAIEADSYLYVYSGNIQHKFLEFAKVTGVFENPEKASELNCEDDGSCEYFDTKYSVEPHMVHDIVNMIVKELAPSIQIPDDKLNNADETPR
jgi:hypothetical protein